jgi:alkanesulfonate monooxygenase SsuD/methylene tetrahydromethanopterin reductase-like flavin-dependent oxidoreductase (luciferase family)
MSGTQPDSAILAGERGIGFMHFSMSDPIGMNQKVKQRSLEELVERRSAIVGGPGRCIDSIRWYESQGVDFMILLVQAGNLKHADICDSLRRFGREVIPKFR